MLMHFIFYFCLQINFDRYFEDLGQEIFARIKNYTRQKLKQHILNSTSQTCTKYEQYFFVFYHLKLSKNRVKRSAKCKYIVT